jgi:hypothetical protein
VERPAENVDDRAVNESGGADRTRRADVASIDAAELRAMTPEEIQILAATGC